MQGDRRFYVYLHRRKTDGSVFYVGKGCDRRSHNFTHRSKYWKRTAAKHGVDVEIFRDGMTQSCALTLERIAIASYGREGLCNLSDGGDGVSNPSNETRRKKSERFSGSRNPQAKNTHYRFWHKAYGEVSCTQLTLRRTFGLESSRVSAIVNGNIRSSLGWFLAKNKGMRSGKIGPNEKTKAQIDHYVNIDGREFIGNHRDFRDEFGFNATNVYKMRTGRKSPYKGWSLKK